MHPDLIQEVYQYNVRSKRTIHDILLADNICVLEIVGKAFLNDCIIYNLFHEELGVVLKIEEAL
jgi:hypothetical protein